MVDARPPPQPSPDTAPPRARDAGAGDAVATGQPDAPPAVEAWCTNVEEITSRLLQPRCGVCHSSAAKAANLDLISPGAKARLIDVPSTLCRDNALVTMTPQVGGFFFLKLQNAIPGCGDVMPAGGLPKLTPSEVECLKAWIASPQVNR